MKQPAGRHSDVGASAAEYALLLGLVAAVIVTAVLNVGKDVLVLFSSVGSF